MTEPLQTHQENNTMPNSSRRPIKLAFMASVVALVAAVIASLTGCSDTKQSAPQATAQSQASAPQKLTIIDSKVGTGATASKNQLALVHYTGWLYDDKAPDHKGKKFDSSRDRGQPFGFPLGGGRVIPGWDEGVQGMKVGGQRTLVIPPDMGYGASGAGGVIPPNATLVFDVELVDVK